MSHRYSSRKEECQVNIFSYFSTKTLIVGIIEAPRWGTSNEYQKHIFLWRYKKNINTFWLKTALSRDV